MPSGAERVGVISTGDFLRELEAARLIQSTDHILDEAAAQGRNIERQRHAIEDATTCQRLREQLTRQGVGEWHQLDLTAPQQEKDLRVGQIRGTTPTAEANPTRDQHDRERDRDRS